MIRRAAPPGVEGQAPPPRPGRSDLGVGPTDSRGYDARPDTASQSFPFAGRSARAHSTRAVALSGRTLLPRRESVRTETDLYRTDQRFITPGAMGIFDFVSKQFIDVIEWTEQGDGVLAFRYPMRDNEIQNGASLTVRETQLALFVNEGRVADLFHPGRYRLTTSTLPVLTYLMNWDKAFASPFKSDVFFFSSVLQLDRKWGTQTALTIRDKEFGPLRVRAYGNYSYKLTDPRLFFGQLSGARDEYTAESLDGQLRALVVSALGSILGSGEIPFVDMAGNQLKFSETLESLLAPEFSAYGLEIHNFRIESVSLPEELQKVLDDRSSMNIVGDMGVYQQFQAAKSIPIAAANEGGAAGAGAGLGAGIALGQVMAQALRPAEAAGGSGGSAAGEDPYGALEKLHGLFTKGILTDEEYREKKAELLKRIS